MVFYPFLHCKYISPLVLRAQILFFVSQQDEIEYMFAAQVFPTWFMRRKYQSTKANGLTYRLYVTQVSTHQVHVNQVSTYPIHVKYSRFQPTW